MFSIYGMRFGRFLCAAVCLSAAASAAQAATSYIWTNSAGSPVLLQKWDLNGNLIQTITGHGTNGRGIVEVGNILYYTSAGSTAVYAYDTASNTDLGTAFTVTYPTAGVSTIAYYGSSFYIRDYSGFSPGLVFKYSPTGTQQAIISLANCSNNCDGLEYVSGQLISNRSDGYGPYDLYSLAGTVQTPAFVADPTPGSRDTGITFDGTNYFVARISTHEILVFDINGVYQSRFTLNGGGQIEDLSVDSAQVPEQSVLKICKVAGEGVTVGTQFDFTANGNQISVPAGPASGGYCVVAGSFAQNSTVTIQETGPAGYGVSAIAVAPQSNLSGTPDLANAIVHVTMGSGVTEVTYTDKAKGYLEICKAGKVTGNFTFSVDGGPPISVPAGACSAAMAVNAGPVAITEGPTPPGVAMAATGCSTLPGGRQVSCAPPTSVVTVVPGDISTMTIATVTNASTRVVGGGRNK